MVARRKRITRVGDIWVWFASAWGGRKYHVTGKKGRRTTVARRRNPKMAWRRR